MEAEEIIIQEYRKGTFYREIAAMLGLSHGQVTARVKTLIKKGLIHKRLKAINRDYNKTLFVRSNGVLKSVLSKKGGEYIEKYDLTPIGNPVTIFGLTNKTCRYYCGNDLYCGADVFKKSFCKGHYERCWIENTQ